MRKMLPATAAYPRYSPEGEIEKYIGASANLSMRSQKWRDGVRERDRAGNNTILPLSSPPVWQQGIFNRFQINSDSFSKFQVLQISALMPDDTFMAYLKFILWSLRNG